MASAANAWGLDTSKLQGDAYGVLKAVASQPQLAGFISNVGGYENRNIAGTSTPSDHGKGEALDFHVPPRSDQGWLLANSVIRAPGTKYVIYNNMIASAKDGFVWKPYKHPSGKNDPTLNHEDHVHWSGGSGASSTPLNRAAAPTVTQAVGSYGALASSAEAKYGLPAGLISAVMQQESGGSATARSGKGASGLMQLMPATARSLGVKNINDPAENVDAGARYLAEQLKKFGSVPLALAAYNAGPGAVSKYGGVPPYKETQQYVSKIMANFSGGGSAPAADPAAIARQAYAVMAQKGLDPARYKVVTQNGRTYAAPIGA